jgi:putative two-component system response regulator
MIETVHQADIDPVSEQLTPIKLLIVDDDPTIRRMLFAWLSKEGYQCKMAENGSRALGCLHRESFSLLICDVMMPGMSGLELLSLAREHHPHLPAIMITGLDDRDTATHAIELGAHGYIIKPFTKSEVIVTIAGVLERARVQRINEVYRSSLEQSLTRRTADVRDREEAIATHLAAVAAFRDGGSGLHIRRVGLSAALIGQAWGVPSEIVNHLRLAAPLHDIGKIGIPDEALFTRIGIDGELLKTHPIIGAQILGGSDIPLLRMARDIAMMHHEHWDGTGYPQGLSGQQIELSARIVTVADALDAHIPDSDDRSTTAEMEALKIIIAGKGQQFDPQIVECLIGVYPELCRVRFDVEAEFDGTSDAPLLQPVEGN